MEFLQGNWFSILLVAVYVAERLITWAKQGERMEQMIKKVTDVEEKIDEAARTFGEHVDSFNQHVSDSSIHVTDMFQQLLHERNEYMKQQFAETRSDVQRIETLLNNMH